MGGSFSLCVGKTSCPKIFFQNAKFTAESPLFGSLGQKLKIDILNIHVSSVGNFLLSENACQDQDNIISFLPLPPKKIQALQTLWFKLWQICAV